MGFRFPKTEGLSDACRSLEDAYLGYLFSDGARLEFCEYLDVASRLPKLCPTSMFKDSAAAVTQSAAETDFPQLFCSGGPVSLERFLDLTEEVVPPDGIDIQCPEF